MRSNISLTPSPLVLPTYEYGAATNAYFASMLRNPVRKIDLTNIRPKNMPQVVPNHWLG